MVGDTSPFFNLEMTEELINYEKMFDKRHDISLTGLSAYTKDRFHLLEKIDVQFLNEHYSRV